MQSRSVIDLLQDDHRGILERLDELRRAGSPGERQRLHTALYDLMDAHALAESAVVYETLRHNDETSELVLRADAEHADARLLAEKMKLADPAGTEFGSQLEALSDALARHIRYEERELCDALLFACSDEDLARLGTEFARAKAIARAA